MADEEFMFGDLFATVRVQDLPASREVVAVERQENGTWRVCGSAIANTDGIAELGIEGSKTSRVYAFAIDHWGEPFTPNKTVAYGDIIRPSVFLGWLYRVTAPGVLPGEEPVWWNSTPGMPRPVGSAMAQAEMYFQPIAHGPVDIEWEEKGVGDPHWDKVVSLLHFDGDLMDETGRVWESVGSSVVSSDESVFGGSSLKVPTTTGLVRAANSVDFDFGSGDFTIEFFLRPSSVTPWASYLDKRESGAFHAPFTIQRNGYANSIRFSSAYAPGSWSVTITAIHPPLNMWTHVVYERWGGVFLAFINGVQVGAVDGGSNLLLTNTATLNIAADGDNAFGMAGYIDELRITKGVARYTENFTPPTKPFPNR